MSMNHEELVDKVRGLWDRKMTKPREARAVLQAKGMAAHRDLADGKIRDDEHALYIDKLNERISTAELALRVAARDAARDAVEPILKPWLQEKTAALAELLAEAAMINQEILDVERALHAMQIPIEIPTCAASGVNDVMVREYQARVARALAPRPTPTPPRGVNANYEPSLGAIEVTVR